MRRAFDAMYALHLAGDDADAALAAGTSVVDAWMRGAPGRCDSSFLDHSTASTPRISRSFARNSKRPSTAPRLANSSGTSNTAKRPSAKASTL
jgi:hypothetical protein